jgi:hypothetical protein
MSMPIRFHRFASRSALACVLIALSVVVGGCNIVGFAGPMIENYRRSSTKTIQAEYTGLKGKNWAVIVQADRSIQAEFPQLVAFLTGKICERMVTEQPKIAAAGMVPPERVLRYQFDHPSWPSMPYSELAKALQVNRLIVVEVFEYRLNEPGNQYLWSGLASGTVGVVEADTFLQDEFAFQKPVRVRFPDDDGFGPADMDRVTVSTALAQRFIDRATWLFYTHEEPYYPKY